jgi:hypothetical protein
LQSRPAPPSRWLAVRVGLVVLEFGRTGRVQAPAGAMRDGWCWCCLKLGALIGGKRPPGAMRDGWGGCGVAPAYG